MNSLFTLIIHLIFENRIHLASKMYLLLLFTNFLERAWIISPAAKSLILLFLFSFQNALIKWSFFAVVLCVALMRVRYDKIYYTYCVSHNKTEKKHKFLEFILIFLHLQENDSMTVTSRGDLNDLVDEGKNSQFMEVLYQK
jgi:hypothetical protein